MPSFFGAAFAAAASSAFRCAWSCAIRSPIGGPSLLNASSCALLFAAPSSRTWHIGSQSFAYPTFAVDGAGAERHAVVAIVAAASAAARKRDVDAVDALSSDVVVVVVVVVVARVVVVVATRAARRLAGTRVGAAAPRSCGARRS